MKPACTLIALLSLSWTAAFAAEPLRNLEYARRGDRAMRLDLYRPAHTDAKAPVVVWIHGGGWNKGSKDKCPATWLTEHGYAVASVEYRLTPEAAWPAQMDDCRDAIRWLRTHAAEYQLDANHIGVWGGSAGGHLVALMGTRPLPAEEKVSARVQAVCDFYGPSDLLTMPANVLSAGKTEEDIANSNGAKLLGGTVRDLPELAKQASALHQVSSDDAPFLIMHGDQDPAVPLTQSEHLHARLLEHKVPSALHVLKGAGHGGKAFQTEEARRIIRQFFDRTLKPSP